MLLKPVVNGEDFFQFFIYVFSYRIREALPIGKDKLITWGLAAASACIDPDNKKLDFDTPVNKNDDFNKGRILGGRIDFHPFGELAFEQGDFKRELKATIGVGVFTWSDDDNTYTNASGVFTYSLIALKKGTVLWDCPFLQCAYS